MTVRPKLVRLGRRFVQRAALTPLIGLLLLMPQVGAPPDVTLTVTGVAGLNGWYRSNVTVDWQVTGETSSSGCDTVTLTVDTPGTKVTCTADNGADQTIKTITIKLDKTPPAAVAAADRPPDANGWYNRPLTVSSSATDSPAGVASCSSAAYGGPDDPTAVVLGSCEDNAGNAAPTSLSFRYDATAPSLTGLRTKPGKRSVDLIWRMSADTQLVQIVRTPGRQGAAQSIVFQGLAATFRDRGLAVGGRYHYRVIGFDAARNSSEQAVDVIGTGALLRPAPGQRVAANLPPRLAWVAVRRASYYNVQLIRRHKILSAWPAGTTFQLRRSWIYKGHRYRLTPGVYHWYVWPGFGRISAGRYGRLLGKSSFVVE